MAIVDVQTGSEAVSTLLRGAVLDSIRVYSLILQLSFIRTGGEGVPGEVWVSLSTDITVEDLSSDAIRSTDRGDFFERRADVLPKLYQLMGKGVTAARISESLALELHIDSRVLCAASSDGLEEMWSVSDSADAGALRRWSVSLDDSGTLAASIPS